MTALISATLPLAVGLLAKTTLLLLSAALACLLLRRASAATRHLVWTAALVGVLLLPLISAALPSWNIALGRVAAASPAPPPAASASLPGKAAATPPVVTPPASAPAGMAPTDLPTPTPKPTVPAPFVLAVAALAVWLVGTLGLLAHLAVGLVRIGQMGRRAKPLEAEALQIAEASRQQIGLRRSVRFLQDAGRSTVAVPVTWGMLHPVVLLPRQSALWSEDCLRAALLHELAHIKRGDWPTQLLARLACALYWWHPLVWGAARQAREGSERAADDCVLRTGMTPANYAERLVEVVRSLPLGARPETAAVTMVRPSEVEGRLRAVLARGNSRRPLTQRGLLGSGLVVMLLVLPLAALRLTPAAQAQDASRSADTGVVVKNGYRAVFANGYEISLVAVTQATRTGDEWDLYGGPWWQLDGTPIGSQSSGISGRMQHWTAARTHDLTPYTFKIAIRPPGGQWQLQQNTDISFFDQFPGSLQPALSVFGKYLANGASPNLITGSAPEVLGSFTSGTLPTKLYPAGTHSCTVRCGMAAGPWHTAVARPAAGKVVWKKAGKNAPGFYTLVSLVPDPDGKMEIICTDTQSRKRIFPFAGPMGRLSDVDWSFQAVDRAGRDVPLTQIFRNVITPGIDLTGRTASGLKTWTTSADIAQIKEFRLQTRPYQTVEFRNVPLQPAADAAGRAPTSAALLTQASDAQLAQAKELRTHLQPWADANHTLLQQMAQAQPNDLAALIRVYDSLERLPFPLWNSDPRLSHGNEIPAFDLAFPSRLTLTHLQRSKTSEDVRMRTDFARYRDMMVSQSVNTGRVHFTLWASGRITRTTAVDRLPGQGKFSGEDESQLEIVGPYGDVSPTPQN